MLWETLFYKDIGSIEKCYVKCYIYVCVSVFVYDILMQMQCNVATLTPRKVEQRPISHAQMQRMSYNRYASVLTLCCKCVCVCVCHHHPQSPFVSYTHPVLAPRSPCVMPVHIKAK